MPLRAGEEEVRRQRVHGGQAGAHGDEPRRKLSAMEIAEKFAAWTDSMDDELRHFVESLPKDIGSALNFDRKSLPVIEKWILEQYDSVESTLRKSEERTLDCISRYVGETIRKSCNGRWAIEWKGRAHTYHDRPVIEDCDGFKESICPLTLVMEAIEERKGNYLEAEYAKIVEGKSKSR